MSKLPSLIESRREEILQRWMAEVQGTLTPKSMPHAELLDHMPLFLNEIVSALRGPPTEEGEASGRSSRAAEHGEQRLRLGFDLNSVVREYGVLHNCIVAVAGDAGVSLDSNDQRMLADCIIAGIATAIGEYTRQRDAEIQRQANEHFAFVAHELRNPLGSAWTALTLMKQQGHLPSGRAAAALERGLRSLRDLIDSSLQLARLSSGITLKPQRVKLVALVDEAQIGESVFADDRNVDVHVKTESDVEIELDARLVGSALSNLIHNAIKFTHPGGTVEVRAKVAEGRICFEIEDQCGGLADGKIEQAFSPFVQLAGGDDRGFGLGLAIAKQAADAHGGTIRVQNLPSKGCMFVLEIPIVVC